MPTELLDYKGADLRIVANTYWERLLRMEPAAREPETVAWIDEHVNAGDVFYDLGANIGGYTLIAASRGAAVYAFEPEAMNYGRLVQNMELNPDLADAIFPLPFALWDKHEILNLHMVNAVPGASQHAIANGTEMEGYPYRQTVFTVQLDDLQTWDIPLPTHMRVGVGGYEWRVINGAQNTLSSSVLKTLMIEIDHAQPDKSELVLSGLKSADLHEKESWEHKNQIRNHLFTRL